MNRFFIQALVFLNVRLIRSSCNHRQWVYITTVPLAATPSTAICTKLLVNIPEFNPPRAKNYDGDTAALMRMHWHIVLASDPAICVGYYLQHRKPRIILCGSRSRRNAAQNGIMRQRVITTVHLETRLGNFSGINDAALVNPVGRESG
jgi:hypothetical protein